MLAVFYAAAAIAVLLTGSGIFWVAAHVVFLLKHVRLFVLPQVTLTLTELQKNLNRIDELTAEVDTTVENANQMVASANRTVQTVEEGVMAFNARVALPLMIGLASARVGVVAGWRAYRASRKAPSGAVVIQVPTAASKAAGAGVLQSPAPPANDG